MLAQVMMFVLEMEAWLENKYIEFVWVVQSAEIKINTFPFAKYGVIEGEAKDMTEGCGGRRRGAVWEQQNEGVYESISDED
ncbi:hypothetical protein QP938_09510 [Porticoccaceae bacterium LTM1]|nr:hypothetical protein QP938_09510 [Porticoccaceae bacterium LTM1]